MTSLRIAVDTGGTFTDVILHDGAGRALSAHKLLSTPDDPSRAVLDGIAAIIKATKATRAPAVIHGSTVATNALLEGRGGKAAFVTTAGFEDTLHIARQHRPQLYALSPRRPAPPIPRERCLGVRERVAFDGAVLTPLSDDEVSHLARRLKALQVDAVAVSLLHSYARGDHERRLGEALAAALPEIHVTLSHELLPEFREYERGATCAVNAVVAPKMGAYLGRLSAALGDDRLRIMASSGGSMTAAEVRRAPVHTVLSGPAGGVVGALAVARAGGDDPVRLITFDMGGTSTDVALCDGDLTLTTEGAVGPLPVRVPLIDIHTVGAGGGSVAWVDAGGALRVGPRSASADPGPACYGRQRAPWMPTVTDAHVVLGRLRPEDFLGGDMTLDTDAAHAAIEQLALELGATPAATALGVLQVAEATMARAIKVISVERGHDPRDFTLVCFGGAGGLHACRLAVELGMRRVLVPQHPGLLSAVGMLFAHSVHSLSRALMRRLDDADERTLLDATDAAHDALSAMTREAASRLLAEGFEAERCAMRPSLAMRYLGQSHELNVPLHHDPRHHAPDLRAALTDFEAAHLRLYGTTSPGRAVEIVTARLRAEGLVQPPQLASPSHRDATASPQSAPRRPIRAVFGRRLEEGHVVQRDALRRGDALRGPLIITEYSSTVVVPPGWRVHLDEASSLVLTREEESDV